MMQGLTLLFVDLQAAEVDIQPIPKAGRNAVVSCEVTFDDLRVPVDHRVGEEGRGFHLPARRPQPRTDPHRSGGGRDRSGR